MWAKSLRLKSKVENHIGGGKGADFLVEKKNRREKGREKKELSRLLSSIYGVPSVGIYRAKNESSSTRRGLRVDTESTGFHRGFK